MVFEHIKNETKFYKIDSTILHNKMYQLVSMLLVMLLATAAAKSSHVVQLKKMVKVNKLSTKTFHNLNRGHLVYNYVQAKAKTDAHLKNFHNLGYAGQISIGQPPQKMTMLFDCAAADILVLSHNHCKFPFITVNPFCWAHSGYNSKKSTPMKREGNLVPLFELTNFGATELHGSIVYDDIKIANDLIIPQATIGVIESWKHSFSYSNVDGVMGIGLREASHLHQYTNIRSVTTLQATAIANRPVLSKALQSLGSSKVAFHIYQDRYRNDIGELIFGAEEEKSRHKGEIEWYPQPAKKEFWSSFWKLDVSEIAIIGISDNLLEKIEVPNHYTTPDPGTSLIAGPASLINKIHNQLFRGFNRPDRESKYGTIEFDCHYQDQLPVIVFTISGRGYILEPTYYVKKFKKKCTTGFMAVDRLGMLVLGDTFLRKYYMVLDSETEKIGLAESIPPPI